MATNSGGEKVTAGDKSEGYSTGLADDNRGDDIAAGSNNGISEGKEAGATEEEEEEKSADRSSSSKSSEGKATTTTTTTTPTTPAVPAPAETAATEYSQDDGSGESGGGKDVAAGGSAAAAAAAAGSSNGAGATHGERMIRFSLGPIQSQLVCELCRGYFREPYTVTKCYLHTFCKSCLTIAVDRGCQYNCPACQTYLGQDVSKFALPDRTLQVLIDKVLFPGVSKDDAKLEREFYRRRGIRRKPEYMTDEAVPDSFYRHDSGDADDGDGGDDGHSDGAGAGARADSRRGVGERKNDGRRDDGADEPRRKKKKRKAKREEEPKSDGNEVTFQLLPETGSSPNGNGGDGANAAASRRPSSSSSVAEADHNNNFASPPPPPPLDMPFLRTNGSIRVGQLKKYLRMQLPAESREGKDAAPRGRPASGETAPSRAGAEGTAPDPNRREFEILCNGVLLGNELSVDFLLRTMWIESEDQKNLVLTYRYGKET